MKGLRRAKSIAKGTTIPSRAGKRDLCQWRSGAPRRSEDRHLAVGDIKERADPAEVTGQCAVEAIQQHPVFRGRIAQELRWLDQSSLCGRHPAYKEQGRKPRRIALSSFVSLSQRRETKSPIRGNICGRHTVGAVPVDDHLVSLHAIAAPPEHWSVRQIEKAFCHIAWRMRVE